jgi:hypothetical protein
VQTARAPQPAHPAKKRQVTAAAASSSDAVKAGSWLRDLM